MKKIVTKKIIIKMKQNIIWSLPKFKDGIEFHWCDIGTILNDDNDLEKRFRMFCRKSDCKCFIEDLKTNKKIEFNCAKAQGVRIINDILEEEKTQKNK